MINENERPSKKSGIKITIWHREDGQVVATGTDTCYPHEDGVDCGCAQKRLNAAIAPYIKALRDLFDAVNLALPKSKPTIEELEMLIANRPFNPIRIMPDGSLKRMPELDEAERILQSLSPRGEIQDRP